MITSYADLLKRFIEVELEILDKYQISHAPTIGDMYEGLTHNFLNRSIPHELNLQIVDGFIANDNGEISSQIDCMLVSGEGERIPHTDHYKFKSKNVIAVIEVKKKLYSTELASSYNNLLSVYKLAEPKESENNLFWDAYIAILGELPPSHQETGNPPLWKEQILRTLIMEEMLPVRIAFGYHGYSQESKFREAFIKFLDKNMGKDGFGAAHFPNLMISNTFSIVKLNGMPYGERINRNDNFWGLLGSYAGNPLVLLLELIWTKITYTFHLFVDGYNNDLKVENLKKMLYAKAIRRNNQIGWEYKYVSIREDVLSSASPFDTWKPTKLNDEQAPLFFYLLENLEVDIADSQFVREWGEDNLEQIANSLIATGLVGKTGSKFVLLTTACKVAFIPDGTLIAGEDNNGRFTNWVSQNT